MLRYSHRKAILTGRCLAEAEWVTTPPGKRTRALSRLPGKPDELRHVPRAFGAWVMHGAAERWRELADADERRRALAR
jgi:hypothetical protein